MFAVLMIRLISLRLLRGSGIVMRVRMFLLLITFLNASHSFRNRLLVICKNAYLFATMIMTSVSSAFSCCSGIYLNAKGALTYTDIAGDPVLYGNLPPREISMKDVFRSGDSSKKFKIAEGQ